MRNQLTQCEHVPEFANKPAPRWMALTKLTRACSYSVLLGSLQLYDERMSSSPANATDSAALSYGYISDECRIAWTHKQQVGST